jgi:hypothetical protein
LVSYRRDLEDKKGVELRFEEQFGFLEQHKNYLAAKAISAGSATCQGWGDFDVPDEPVVEGTKNRTEYLTWEIMRRKLIISRQGDVDSHLTLDSHLADPLFKTSDSPFDVLDDKLPDEEKIRKLIGYLRHKSNIQFAPELAARLDFLCGAAKEEEPDRAPISLESLNNFIAFLQKTPTLRYPSVVLTPSNEISAEWRTAPNRHFAVVFLPTGETRFVIFTPNLRDPDKIDRLFGVTVADSLMETAQPHRVLEWASQ